MIIKQVEAAGFRHWSGVRVFPLGSDKLITGENFKGKSSIGGMVLYALTGLDLDGKANNDGDLMHDHTDQMQVRVLIQADDGQDHLIERSAVKAKGKVSSSIRIDNVKATQAKVESIIGERKFFAAAFLPQVFCNLEPADARKFLVPLLPAPEHEEVMAKLTPDQRELIQAEQINDVDLLIKKKNAAIEKDEAEIPRMSGSLDELQNGPIGMGIATWEDIPDPLEYDPKPEQNILAKIKAIQASSPELTDLRQMKTEKDKLLQEFQTIKRNLDFEDHMLKCPNCQHEINLKPNQDESNEKISRRMGEIRIQGERLAEQITELEAANDKKLQEFQTKNQAALDDLNQQLKALEPNKQRIQEHNARVKMLTKQRDAAAKRRTELEASLEKVQASIQRDKAIVKALKEYGRTFSELQVKRIEENLERVSLKLFEVTQDGEIRPVFRLMYDGKEYRKLSDSEKVRTGLEISQVLRDLTGRGYPVFIDNGESITHLNKAPGTQLIMTKAVEGADLQLSDLDVQAMIREPQPDPDPMEEIVNE